MPIIVSCTCGKHFRAADQYVGQQAKCPHCAQPITIKGQLIGADAGLIASPHPPQAQAHAQPTGYSVLHSETIRAESAEAVSPQAAAVLLQREFHASTERNLRRNILIGIGSAAVGAALVFLVVHLSRGEPNPPAPDAVAQAQPPLPPPAPQPDPAIPLLPPAPTPKVEQKTVPEKTPEKTQSAPASKPPEPAPKKIERLDTTGEMSEVERFVRTAINARDGHLLANALIFKPDDPRLQIEYEDRPVPRDALDRMDAPFKDVDVSAEDLETFAAPSAKTEELEARLLLDPDVVGSGLWVDAAGEQNRFLVFLDPCKLSIAQIQQKYGKPGKTLPAGAAILHFYGRFVLMEGVGKGGAVHGVLRKVTKDAGKPKIVPKLKSKDDTEGRDGSPQKAVPN